VARDYDLLIFDWDGTLMDSEAKIVRCFELAAADANVNYPGHDAVRNIIGLGLAEAMEALYPEEEPVLHNAVVESYREHFLFRDQTKKSLMRPVPITIAPSWWVTRSLIWKWRATPESTPLLSVMACNPANDWLATSRWLAWNRSMTCTRGSSEWPAPTPLCFRSNRGVRERATLRASVRGSVDSCFCDPLPGKGVRVSKSLCTYGGRTGLAARPVFRQ
jgi:hypothetical protein